MASLREIRKKVAPNRRWLALWLLVLIVCAVAGYSLGKEIAVRGNAAEAAADVEAQAAAR